MNVLHSSSFQTIAFIFQIICKTLNESDCLYILIVLNYFRNKIISLIKTIIYKCHNLWYIYAQDSVRESSPAWRPVVRHFEMEKYYLCLNQSSFPFFRYTCLYFRGKKIGEHTVIVFSVAYSNDSWRRHDCNDDSSIYGIFSVVRCTAFTERVYKGLFMKIVSLIIGFMNMESLRRRTFLRKLFKLGIWWILNLQFKSSRAK